MKETGTEKTKTRCNAGCAGSQLKTERLTQEHCHKFKISLGSKGYSGLPGRNRGKTAKQKFELEDKKKGVE